MRCNMTRGVWRQYQSPAEKRNDRHIHYHRIQIHSQMVRIGFPALTTWHVRLGWVALTARNAGVPEPTGCTGASNAINIIEAHDPHSMMIVPPLGESAAAPTGQRRVE